MAAVELYVQERSTEVKERVFAVNAVGALTVVPANVPGSIRAAAIMATAMRIVFDGWNVLYIDPPFLIVI